MIDARLTFADHLDASNKVAVVNAALSRLMPNIGPCQEKRKRLALVVRSVLLYGAPVWANSTSTNSYVRGMASVYRLSALQVACAFRTVSNDAVFVIAGMPPVDILAQERRSRYHKEEENPNCSTTLLE